MCDGSGFWWRCCQSKLDQNPLIRLHHEITRLKVKLKKAIGIRGEQPDATHMACGVLDGKLDAAVPSVDELDSGGRRVNPDAGGPRIFVGSICGRQHAGRLGLRAWPGFLCLCKNCAVFGAPRRP
jgi:hypothetical protein